jgi:hypothetical protein
MRMNVARQVCKGGSGASAANSRLKNQRGQKAKKPGSFSDLVNCLLIN